MHKIKPYLNRVPLPTKQVGPYLSLLLLSLLFLSSAHAVTVDNVRLWPAPDHTRLVLDLSAPVSYNYFTLDGPRLVIDINDASMIAKIEGLDLSNTPIEKIRTGAQDNRLRVVLDLKEAINPNIFTLQKMQGLQDRLVVDLEYVNRGRQSSASVNIVDPTTNNRRDIVIAIVAGHGGEDPGAVGPGRLFEKDITLKIAQNLERVINATPGYKAVMLRTGDYYVNLTKRREMARQNRADLFLAIHADGFHQRSASGASVYALNANGKLATSETARYLAERENEADLIGGVGTVSIKEHDEDVASTLMSLSRSATLRDSLQAGQYILDSIEGIAKLHKKQVEQADFVVLRAPDVPSLLIETGFISNPAEAKRLSTLAYRRQMADSIFAGVKNYFYNHSPPGTYIAWQKENGGLRDSEHIIARGETLSGIALRYNVSVNDLVSFNRLQNTNIRIGQKLKIPTS